MSNVSVWASVFLCRTRKKKKRLIDESSHFLTHGHVSELEEKTSTSNRAQFLNRTHICLVFNAPVT